MFGTRPDEGIGPYKMHTVGPRALTGPPLPRFNYPDKSQFVYSISLTQRRKKHTLNNAKEKKKKIYKNGDVIS